MFSVAGLPTIHTLPYYMLSPAIIWFIVLCCPFTSIKKEQLPAHGILLPYVELTFPDSSMSVRS